jgi:hypothetical protein
MHASRLQPTAFQGCRMTPSVGPLFVKGVAVPSCCLLLQVHMMCELQYEDLLILHDCWYQLVPLSVPHPMWGTMSL